MRFGSRFAFLAIQLAAGAPAFGGSFVSQRGAVAAASPQASAAGAEMLRRGGNAFDAVVAAALVEGVVQPFYSGLGGGGFLVAWLANGKQAVVLDFREVAPAASTASMYLRDGKPDPTRSRDGALAIATLGAPAGYAEIERRFGKLGFDAVAEPAMKVAEQGFRITPLYRGQAQARLECLANDPDAGAIFLAARQGKPAVPDLGATLVQHDLAKTLRAWAKDGGATFYRGAVASRIVEEVTKKGGILSAADLAKYQVRERKPLWGSYRGYRIATMPPPSGGGVTLLAILGVLEGLDLTAYRAPQEIHFFAEASKRVYADRAAWFGDPDYVSTDLGPFGTKDYAEKLRRSIDGAHAIPSQTLRPTSPGDIAIRDGGHTTHISVIDVEGNAAAMTTTVNYAFGSCVVARGTGVILNDQMDDFAQAPGAPNVYGLVTGTANAIAPGKVPLSSMVPTIVFQKDDPARVYLAIGSPGGPLIPTSVAWTMVNLIDHHMPIDRAIATTRVHHQYLPDSTLVEPPGLEAATMAALTALGHHLQVLPRPWCDVEAVLVDPVTGWREAASDPRWEGAPAGE